MKILAIVPITTGIYKNESTWLCEGLEKYHNVEIIKVNNINENGKNILYTELKNTNINDIDLIWACYEKDTVIAELLKKKFNVPTIGHFEIIAPWRAEPDHKYTWVNGERDDYNVWEKDYINSIKSFVKLDTKMACDSWTIHNIEMLYGEHIPNILIKKYGIPDEYLKSFSKDTEEKNQIITISRLVSHKKIHHIICVLSQMESPPKYVVIGMGPELNNLKEYAKRLNVDVEFMGMVNDEEKVRAIQESMFAVHPWAWLPTGECAVFKKPSIVYDTPTTRRKLKNMPTYVRNNDLQKLQDTIILFCKDKELRKKKGKRAYDTLMNKETDLLSLKDASKFFFDIFTETLKK